MSELLDRIITVAQENKYEVCQDNGGPADIAPIIIGLDDTGTPFMMPDTMEGHPTDNLAYILQHLANGLHDKNGTMKWQWIAYVVEGYLNDSETIEGLDEHQRGDYERDYKNNPASTVKEGIIASLYTWEGEDSCQTTVYHYGDDGMPVWETTLEPDEHPEGMVPFIIRSFREFCKKEGDIVALLGDME